MPSYNELAPIMFVYKASLEPNDGYELKSYFYSENFKDKV
jgi:hypothetical protein